MGTAEQKQRRRESRKKSDGRIVRLQVGDRMGNPRWVTADLIDVSESGVGISLRTMVELGSKVVLRGDLGEQRRNVVTPATVKWCTEKINGSFHAGLQLGEDSGPTADAIPQASFGEQQDWYEVMQLSPNADAETIARVYRLLAVRFHPDSPTGDQKAFLALCEAYRVLSDPARRAQYDARYWETKKLRWRIFDRAELAASPEAEQRKRRAILEALYAQAMHDPEGASMGVFDFEELLGCPREHLAAALWYLKGKGQIKRADNNRYSITVAGFDEVESGSGQTHDTARRLLQAANSTQ